MPLTVLIAGGGRVGLALAGLLSADGHQVVLVEDDPVRVGELREQVPDATIVPGDATDPGVLEAAGAHNADVVAAVSGDDPTNLLVTNLARYEFAVPRTIARIVDPGHAWLYTEEMGVDVALDQARLIAHVVAEEMSLGEMTTLVKLRRGQFALVEERVHPSAPAVGRLVADLDLPHGCVLVAVIRGEEVLPAHGRLALQAQDEVLAVVHAQAAPVLHELLRSP